jgi:hypothetical protein
MDVLGGLDFRYLHKINVLGRYVERVRFTVHYPMHVRISYDTVLLTPSGSTEYVRCRRGAKHSDRIPLSHAANRESQSPHSGLENLAIA